MHSEGLKNRVMEVVDAHGYGPFGYVRAAAAGFLLGSLAYIFTAYGSYSAGVMIGPSEVPVLLEFSAAAIVLALLAAIIGNFLIGRRIRDNLGH